MSWTALIGAGLSFLGSKKESKANESAARENREAIKEAATPKSVYDPMGAAVWDPASDSYKLQLSPEQQRLYQGYYGDIYRQRALVEPMMRDPEAAALQRYNKDLETLKLGEDSAIQSGLRKGHAAGLGVGSTLGVGALGEIDRVNLANRSALLSSSRTGVQSDITDYLNRAEAARKGMFSVGVAPQELANIGQGNVSNSVNAAAAGGAPYLKAQQAGNLAASQPYQQLGGHFASLNKIDPYQQLAYQAGWNSPQGYQAGYSPQAYQAGRAAGMGGK